VYVGENTSQAASVEFVRRMRTNYARSRLQKNWRKSPKGFFDKLKTPAEEFRRGCMLYSLQDDEGTAAGSDFHGTFHGDAGQLRQFVIFAQNQFLAV